MNTFKQSRANYFTIRIISEFIGSCTSDAEDSSLLGRVAVSMGEWVLTTWHHIPEDWTLLYYHHGYCCCTGSMKITRFQNI